MKLLPWTLAAIFATSTLVLALHHPASATGAPAPEPAVRCDRCKYMFPPLGVGGCRLVR